MSGNNATLKIDYTDLTEKMNVFLIYWNRKYTPVMNELSTYQITN